MKVFELRSEFGLANLTMADRPLPEPGPHEVRVRMTAATLNYRDLLVVEGRYDPRLRFPLVPVSDGAGVMDAVGDKVTRFKPGDRVTAILFQGWLHGEPTTERLATGLGAHLDGVLSEYRVFPEAGVLRVPDYLSDAEAAAFPCAGVTAWSAIVTLGRVAPGEVVLIQGTGGVALFALQFAKLAGATVILTSSSDDKLKKGRALGADHLINYKSDPDWSRAAKALTGGLGVDHIIEIGGASTLAQSLRAIRVGGTVSMIGVVGGPAASDVPLPLIVMRKLRLQGVTLGSGAEFAAMLRACEAAQLHPVLDPHRYRFDQAREAIASLAAGEHFGKIVIEFD